MIARILAAFAHGTLFGVGAVVAADLVPPNKRASAIGLMFTGLTLANILGVPLGTLVGQDYGWRATFWRDHRRSASSPSIPVAVLVPDVADAALGGLRHEFSVLRRPEVLLAHRDDGPLLGAASSRFFTYIVPLLRGGDRLQPERRHADPLHDRRRPDHRHHSSAASFADRGIMRALIAHARGAGGAPVRAAARHATRRCRRWS